MLGRLRMSVEECIKAYNELSSQVFQRKHYSPIKVSGKLKARFDGDTLKKAIQKIVAENDESRDGDALLLDDREDACHV